MLNCGYLQVCVDGMSLPFSELSYTFLPCCSMVHRYLNKLYSSKLPMSALPTNVCYLATDYPAHSSCGVRSVDQFSDPHTQLEAYRQRARRMVGVANSAYQRALGRGLTQAQAWNETTIDWTVAAKVRILNFFAIAIFHNFYVSLCVCVCICRLIAIMWF